MSQLPLPWAWAMPSLSPLAAAAGRGEHPTLPRTANIFCTIKDNS